MLQQQKTITRCMASAALCIALGSPNAALAFQPLQTDDTGTQGKGGHQFELAYTHTPADDLSTTQRSLATTYTYGVLDSLDVYVGAPFVSNENGTIDSRGWSNITYGAKWRFLDIEEKKLSFALKAEGGLGAGNARETEGYAVGKAAWNATLILSQEMPFGAIHANLAFGRTFNFDETLDNSTRRYSVAPVFTLNEQWRSTFEVGYKAADKTDTVAGAITERSRFGLIGLIYSPNKTLDAALGIGREVSYNHAGVSTYTAGITLHF